MFSGTLPPCSRNANPHPGTFRPDRLILRSSHSATQASAYNMSEDPAFLLFTGDFVRHHPEQMPHPWQNVTEVCTRVVSCRNRALRVIPHQRSEPFCPHQVVRTVTEIMATKVRYPWH